MINLLYRPKDRRKRIGKDKLTNRQAQRKWEEKGERNGGREKERQREGEEEGEGEGRSKEGEVLYKRESAGVISPLQ